MIEIITAISTAAVVIFTAASAYMKRKQRCEEKPMITDISPQEKGRFEITIVNTSAANLVVKQIFVKELTKNLFKPAKKKNIETNHPAKLEHSSGLSAPFTFNTYTFIKDQETYHLTIPGFSSKARYRLYVKTNKGMLKSQLPPAAT